MVKMIIGRNGSGKTTYIRKECQKNKSVFVSAKAETPGESIFSKLTIEELITTSKSNVYIDNVIEILKYFSMHELWTSTIGNLSGGELKILNISMLLGIYPLEIYLDEPGRDLSIENIKKLVNLINSLSRKIKFNIVTHTEEIFDGIKNKKVFEMKNFEINFSEKKKWGDYENSIKRNNEMK